MRDGVLVSCLVPLMLGGWAGCESGAGEGAEPDVVALDLIAADDAPVGGDALSVDEARPPDTFVADLFGSENLSGVDLAPPVDLVAPQDLPPADDVAANPAGIEWIALEGGSFLMGSSGGEPEEQPAHEVTVPPFEMARREVTFAQYELCVLAGACSPAHVDDGACHLFAVTGWYQGDLPAGLRGPQQPVVCVTWQQARDFATWAGGRLPSEAEWEYAARSSGRNVVYPWGDETATCARAVMSDGGSGCGTAATAVPCSKPLGESDQGVCDLSGNVWEWCADHWVDSYEGAPIDGSAREGSGAAGRATRGGSFRNLAGKVRAARRDPSVPDYPQDFVGFRVVR